jgi:hypothetical protein
MKLIAAVGSLLSLAVVAGGCAQPDATEPHTITVPVFAQAVDGTAMNMRTHLSGAGENPPTTTEAQGQAIFQVSADGTELHYKLNVANIQDALMAHIHHAAPGSNGGIVVWLYPSAPPAQLIPGRFEGTLGEGVITDAQVIGDLAGTGVAGLLAAMQAGNTYVNVHTVAHPGGEIRGQVF